MLFLFLKYVSEGSQLFLVDFSRKVRKSLKNTNTSISNEKKKKLISYTPGAFTLNKTQGFLVPAEERDKATLKNYQNKVHF